MAVLQDIEVIFRGTGEVDHNSIGLAGHSSALLGLQVASPQRMGSLAWAVSTKARQEKR